MASPPEFEPRLLCWEVSATLPWLELDAAVFLCSERFFSRYSGFPLSSKFNSIWNASTLSNEFLKCLVASWAKPIHFLVYGLGAHRNQSYLFL